MQSGVSPNRVLRVELDRALTRVTGWSVLAANLPSMDEPSHGAIIDGDFYFVANSQIGRLLSAQSKGVSPADAQLSPTVILRVGTEAGAPR